MLGIPSPSEMTGRDLREPEQCLNGADRIQYPDCNF